MSSCDQVVKTSFFNKPAPEPLGGYEECATKIVISSISSDKYEVGIFQPKEPDSVPGKQL